MVGYDGTFYLVFLFLLFIVSGSDACTAARISIAAVVVGIGERGMVDFLRVRRARLVSGRRRVERMRERLVDGALHRTAGAIILFDKIVKRNDKK